MMIVSHLRKSASVATALVLFCSVNAGTAKDGKPAGADKGQPAVESAPRKTGLPQVLDFGAVWCVPCKKLAPVFDKVAAQYKGKADFIHYDVDVGEGKKLADKYKIDIMPTVLFMTKDGTIKSKKDGKITEQDLIQSTDALLK